MKYSARTAYNMAYSVIRLTRGSMSHQAKMDWLYFLHSPANKENPEMLAKAVISFCDRSRINCGWVNEVRRRAFGYRKARMYEELRGRAK